MRSTTTATYPTGGDPFDRGQKLAIATHYIPQSVVLTGSLDKHLEYADEPPNDVLETAFEYNPRRGHTAMYAGMRHLETKCSDYVYIGLPGPIYDSHGTEVDIKKLHPSYESILVSQLRKHHNSIALIVDTNTGWGHYEGYCKNVLWPLLHYQVQFSNTVYVEMKRYWNDYQTVNNMYAETLTSILSPGDNVWVHDYHLLLVPAYLRKKMENVNIGLFLHTVVPSSEIFRCLPSRKQLLQGMLGADLIGFQTYNYARHFISSCTRVLGLESSPSAVEYDGHQVITRIYPIGVDVERTKALARTSTVKSKIQILRQQYAGKRIIIGRDKRDQIRGVYQKLLSFEKFLDRYPQWQNQLVLIQVTSPSAYSSEAMESKVSDLVARINRRHGSITFSPVQYIQQNLAQEEYYALLSAADVALITSIRDGMNTTSYEYVVCQEEDMGPMIMSEFTGTATSMSSALLINPWDTEGVAAVINEALSMPKQERITRYKTLADYVERNTAQSWAETFLTDLLNRGASLVDAGPMPRLPFDQVKQSFNKAKKRLLLFDYDGTLTPIVKSPPKAVPSERILSILTKLSQNPSNIVYIISGRDQEFLALHFDRFKEIGLSAEHGCFVRSPSTTEWKNYTEALDLSWMQEVLEVFNYYTERTVGSWVERKKAAVVWHYREADPNFASFQAKELQNHLDDTILTKRAVEMILGKKALEVRPLSINKGEIVRRLLSTFDEAEFVFCIGDDKTDEDMFKILRKVSGLPTNRDREIVTCTVGPANKVTNASYHIDGTDRVADLLASFVE